MTCGNKQVVKRMASSSSPCVQWEWCDDALCWNPYPPPSSALIEAAYEAGHPTGLFSAGRSHYSVHFQPLQQIQKNPVTGKTRPIERRISNDGKRVTWVWWENDTQIWHPYDEQLAAQIEAAWKENCVNKTTSRGKVPAGLSFKIRRRSYNIEFEADGMQFNLKTQFGRRVRRNATPSLESDVGIASSSLVSGSENGTQSGDGAPTHLSQPASSIYNAINGVLQPRSSLLTCRDYEDMGGQSYHPSDIVDMANPHDKGDCSICLNSLEEGGASLSKCKHVFHRDCIELWFKTRPSCPECLTLYGLIIGTQPPGEMHVQYIANGPGTSNCELAGYPGLDVIRIMYNFSSGIQTNEHPHPGKSYTGTSRIAFLPKNRDGEEVLELLKKAWTRRLLFRIGTSVTTGQNDVVTWAGVHHKTRRSGGSSNHGYPDDTYFSRVKKELEDVGVVSSLSEDY